MSTNCSPSYRYHDTRYFPIGFKLYEGTDYFSHDNFNQQLKKILQGSLYLRGNKFIAPLDELKKPFTLTNAYGQCFLVEAKQIEVIEHALLADHHLVCGKLYDLALRQIKLNNLENYQPFLTKLLCLFYDYLLTDIDILKKHFSLREIEKQKMIHHHLIRHQLAEVYINLQYCQLLIQDAMLAPASQLLYHLFSQLGKLAGGRAFLAKNIHEMQALLFIFNQIYFSEE